MNREDVAIDVTIQDKHPEQAGGDERAAFEVWASALGWKLSPDQNNCGIVVAERYGHPGVQRCWEAWQARAALAQPSPAQAEAERPEVVAYFDRNYPSTGDAFIWSNYEGSPYEPVMTVAQHDRIVGELRAEIAMLRSYEAEWELLLNEHEQQRDAALARVEQQERTIAGMNEAHAKLAGLYEAAQAQHSVPEASEQEKEQGWTLDYRFVERVTELAASRTEYTTSMEATEQVLLAARELLAAAPGKEVGHE
ncbi:hypothetical protein [Pseudomonas aeruginosa]|uniref:hypothetical protein n=1 Tax=Pseudomonas aeruginosa TaxID=287 RepID=UPI0029C0FC68|nr:hypothetical protein [Pseudomonas aeruginosa]